MKNWNLIFKIILLLFCSVSLQAEQLPQFDTTKYSQQIFWLVIIFGIFYVFIHYFVIPKLTKLKIQRKNRILDTLEKASKLNKDIAKIEQEINDIKLDILQSEVDINDEMSKKITKIVTAKNSTLEQYKIGQQKLFAVKSNSYKKIYKKNFTSEVNSLTKTILNKLNLQHYENKVK